MRRDGELGKVVVVETDGKKITKAGLRPWQESHTRNTPGKDDHVWVQEISETVQVPSPFEAPAPPTRRSGQERMEELAGGMWRWIQENLQRDTNWAPPRSLIEAMRMEAWRQGDPITFERVKQYCMESLERQRRMQRNDAIPVVGKPGEWAAPKY